MKKKRTARALLALVSMLSLVGCTVSAGTQPTAKTESTGMESSVTESTAAVTETVTTEPATAAPTTAKTIAPTTQALPVTTKKAKPTAPPTKAPESTAPTTAKSEPTEKQTEKPTEKPTENQSEKPANKTTFFDDAVFVGDSVTLGLKNIATAQRNAGKSFLGKAKFLCSGSLSYSNCTMALDNPRSVHPKIKGKKVFIEDGVKTLGAKKVFIMLGMNDFAAYDDDKVIEKAVALVGRIQKKSPGTEIYIESVTPITADKQHGEFNNKNVHAFNQKLIAMCKQHGWTYVDINRQFRDENGCLKKAYCGDPNGMGIHMTEKGCVKWAEYLTSLFAS